ncbi:MAG: UDP-glucose 4-epimerase GalE, partial [Thermoleophilia bacterium]|nr:UDP-glucose 4-epimerase GalE [Thermoleophilia bacterium]
RLAATMADLKVDAVMHFAALTSVPDSIKDPQGYYTVNVLGTRNVLDAMLKAGVPRILFSSTAATYAFDVPMPLREDSPQRPERMIKDYARAYDLGYAILRYFNASGADPDGKFGEHHRKEGHLIPLTLMVALGQREKLLIFGDDWDTRDGTCVRDYVHTEDLAQAHQLAVEALRPGVGLSYNLGSGSGTTILEVLRACEEVVGRPIRHEFAPRRPGDPATLVATPEKITRELGWSPKYTDIRSIAETAWRWHESHPQGYGPKA